MVLILTSTVALLLILGFAHEFVRLQLMPRLASPATPGAAVPRISVIIPARNEAHTIGRCLDGLLAQTYPAYEVLVVDDASTDATPAILADYARRHPRLRVLTGTDLPPEWTGKAHACQQAASVADGQWLLFLDADTVPQPGLLAALATHTHRYGLDMLTLFPFVELRSFWERLILPPFQAIIRATFPYERLNDPAVRPGEVVANGQCIFVRRAAYEAIGGHSAVRAEVLEDVYLAQTLRTAGFRTGAVEGMRYLAVRMYTCRRDVVEGLTKNAVAGYCSNRGRAAWAGVRQFFLALAPGWLLLSGAGLVLAYGDALAWAVLLQGALIALIAGTFWRVLLGRLYALPWGYALLWPVGLVAYGIIALHSLWRVASKRGVIWKGRTYAGT